MSQDLDAPTAARKRSRVLPWVVGVLLLAGGGFGWWRAHGADAAGGATSRAASAPGGGRRFGGLNQVQPVSVQAARRQDIRVNVDAIGSIAASNTATVRAQVSGVLQRLNFEEGQQVQAGQWLAQIDPRPFQAALAQAEGTLARDKAQLDGARVDLARYRDLLAKDALPRQQLDSQAALVAQLEGTVKADQGAADSARLQLSWTRVTAPIAGRVGLKQIDLGNMAQASDANGIVRITQTRPIAMIFAVPASNVPIIAARLHADEPIPVEAWDRGGKRRLALGRVASVDNAIDPATDTIKVKALFPNADDALFPNQAVSVVLQRETLAGVLAVPQAAVLRGAQGFYVYVVNADSSVSTRVVTPGAVDGGWMAVEGALQPGEKVVVDGTDRLREGAKVEVIATDPAQRAGAAAAPASSADAGHSRRMDRLPPAQAEALKAMSPEARRAWFKAHRDQPDADSPR
jgi:multidrug efflux system membrane fusion protein